MNTTATRGKRTAKPALIGGATILTALMCVCVTALSVLSLLGANAELALAERTEQYMCEYYEADAAAQEYAASLKKELIETGGIEPRDGLAVETSGEFTTIEFDQSINDTNAISVAVEFGNDGETRIRRWARTFTAEQVFFDDNEFIWSGN